jgi:hypothetical protein
MSESNGKGKQCLHVLRFSNGDQWQCDHPLNEYHEHHWNKEHGVFWRTSESGNWSVIGTATTMSDPAIEHLTYEDAVK